MNWTSYGIALGAVVAACVVLEFVSPWITRLMVKRQRKKIEKEAWADSLSRRYFNLTKTRAEVRKRQRADD